MGLFANPQPSGFVLALPKAELHLHLEGAIEPATLLEIQQSHGLKTATLSEVMKLYEYADFTSFLISFKNITEHLKEPADYELVTYRLMERLKAENVVHAEVYISVGVCLYRKQDFAAIFEGLERGRARGERDFGVSLLWIFDAVRHFGSAAAQQVAELAVQYQDRHVVGFGIGGDERKAGPELFREVYSYSGEHGLRLTAHAGETTGPDSVWGALNLRAERIGHALTARPIRMFPAARFPGMLDFRLDGSLYELLEVRYGLRPHRARESLEPVTAGVREAEALEVAEGAPLMLVERTAYARSGEPLEFARDLFRGDRTRVVVWTSELAEDI